MMLVFFVYVHELFFCNRCVRGIHLAFSPIKYLLRLQAVVRILHIFAVFHHAVNVIANPACSSSIAAMPI